jgi:hypothetical protein
LPVLERFNNLLVSPEDAMLHSRLHGALYQLSREAWASTDEVQRKISPRAKSLDAKIINPKSVYKVKELDGAEYMTCYTRKCEIIQTLRGIREQIGKEFTLILKIDSDEVREELLTDFTHLDKCVRNAIKWVEKEYV